ncbi:hypothetical protein BC332_13587 [Capsicum chinense]|nr:hypothetical protein BC332_13587 [Capsicum chinense]
MAEVSIPKANITTSHTITIMLLITLLTYQTKIQKTQKTFAEFDHKGFPGDDALNISSERDFSKLSPGGDRGNGQDADMDSNANKIMVDQDSRITS